MPLRHCGGLGRLAWASCSAGDRYSLPGAGSRPQVITRVKSGGRAQAHVAVGRKESWSCRISLHLEITSLLTAEFIGVIADFFQNNNGRFQQLTHPCSRRMGWPRCQGSCCPHLCSGGWDTLRRTSPGWASCGLYAPRGRSPGTLSLPCTPHEGPQ